MSVDSESASDKEFEQALIDSARGDEPGVGPTAAWSRLASSIGAASYGIEASGVHSVETTGAGSETTFPSSSSVATSSGGAATAVHSVGAVKLISIGLTGGALFAAGLFSGITQVDGWNRGDLSLGHSQMRRTTVESKLVADSAVESEEGDARGALESDESVEPPKIDRGSSASVRTSSLSRRAGRRSGVISVDRNGGDVGVSDDRSNGPTRLSEAPREVERIDTLAAEIEALDAARREVNSGDPYRGLRLLDEYAARFENGKLARDAAVVRMTALSAVGRQLSVRHEAERFLERYPRDPQVDRVRRLLQ